MEAFLAIAGFRLVFAAQVVALPAAAFWVLSRFVGGVSPGYVARCLYLELKLRARAAMLDTGSHGAQEKAASSSKARCGPPSLTKEQKSIPLRGVNVSTEAEFVKATSGQTAPPTKRVSTLLAGREPPLGEERSYGSSSSSSSSSRRPSLFQGHFGRPPKEASSLGQEEDEAWQHRVRCLREGAEVHRQVRQYVQQKLRPGLELREIVEMVENASSAVVGFDQKNPLRRGWAFPTGLSLNEVAAHDTVNPGDAPRWLMPGDIGSIDFGVHIDGHILDCAFTFAFDSVHDELMQAVKDATNEGIRRAGPDALVAEVGGYIQEVMEAAEVHRPDGKVIPIYSIKNLTGHNIAPYRIHSGKSLPSVNVGGNVRMLAGELWAVETFGSAGGVGYVVHSGDCSHFMRTGSARPSDFMMSALSESAKSLLDLIDRRFSTLAFCPRWIVREAEVCKTFAKPRGAGGGGADPQRWWAKPLQELCNIGAVQRYPPLADLPGCYTAQYEHTVLLRESCKEVLTRGSDY